MVGIFVFLFFIKLLWVLRNCKIERKQDIQIRSKAELVGGASYLDGVPLVLEAFPCWWDGATGFTRWMGGVLRGLCGCSFDVYTKLIRESYNKLQILYYNVLVQHFYGYV